MDWAFITDEIFELLDSNGLNDSTISRLDSAVITFVNLLKSRMVEDTEYSEDQLDSEIDLLDEPLDIDLDFE